MKNLKIYDPDPEKRFTRAKVARLKQEHTYFNFSVEINKRCERIKRSLFKGEEEIVEIESQTRQQSACQEWYKHRFGRVTASKSYRVGCNHKADTSPTKIIKDALRYNEDYQSQVVKDG